MDNINFVYNDKSLFDFDCMLCNFDSKSNIEVLETPTITFNTVQNNQNDTFNLTHTSYDRTLESSDIGICKIDCQREDIYFTQDEIRAIYKWLDLRSFKNLIIENVEDFEDVYFVGGFTTIQQVKNNGRTIGFKLKFTSKYPYALSNDLLYRKTITSDNKTMIIINDSDDVRPLYPSSLKITLLENGNLTISNNLDSENDISIKNCKKDEVIEIDCQSRIIETSYSSHDIYNDFNYNYFRLIRNDKTDINEFEFNLLCEIEVVFNEPRKVGFI